MNVDWRSLLERAPDRLILANGKPYMEHYRIAPGERLHRILCSDPDRDLHDHPWDFRSTILAGSYVELTPAGEREWLTGDEIVHQARDAHRLIVEDPVITLFRFGNFQRTWGFHTPTGWVPHHRYAVHADAPPPPGW